MTADHRPHLRRLAETYAGYAHCDTMAKRREKWSVHNRLKARTVPFHIEDNGTYFHDLCPPLLCEDPTERNLEARLVHAITAYEKIDDDRIIPDRFVVDWVTETGNICDELSFTRAAEQHGATRGYASNKPIRNIDDDFHKLTHRSLTIDRETTEARAELAIDIFEGLLPVVVGRTSTYYSDGIANKAVHLMGMQELYLQMAANPDAVHRLLTFLAEDNLALGAREEEEGLLTLNNDGNQGYCSGSSQYSDEIPGREIPEGEPIRSIDRYGYLEAQEAAGISPDMFAEFLMPHFEKLARFKLMKFGCCEAVHAFMPHLVKLRGLRKVTVSPWCDLRALAAACPPNVIWSRKPVPLKLCGPVFDPDDFHARLAETLEIGKDHFIELVFRDTNRLTGAMEGRIAQACRIVRELTG
jgi:hypothetical protein